LLNAKIATVPALPVDLSKHGKQLYKNRKSVKIMEDMTRSLTFQTTWSTTLPTFCSAAHVARELGTITTYLPYHNTPWS
jgi:hypothetical protein